MDLFMAVVKLAASIPVSAKVERELAASFQVMRSVQNSKKRIVNSHRDVDAIWNGRNPKHLKAKGDEQFRTELLLDILQYVSNALRSAALLCSLSCAGEPLESGTVAAASPGDLVRWVQKRFLPFVRERLPECMLSPLLTAACDWGGQLQMTPASLGAAAATPGTGCGAGGGSSMLTDARQHERSGPVISAGHQRSAPEARRLAFGVFQHLHNRCETCATECNSARSRFVCSAVQFAVRHAMV